MKPIDEATLDALASIADELRSGRRGSNSLITVGGLLTRTRWQDQRLTVVIGPLPPIEE